MHVWNLFAREPGDPRAAGGPWHCRPRREGPSRNPKMNGPRKSDRSVVPEKPPNKAGRPAAGAVEGRGLAAGNVDQQNVRRTLSRGSTPSALDRVREAARRQKGRKFTALLHHVTVERLRAAFEALQPKAAAGVDGVTWEQYREGLDEKLVELHARVHRGAYRARPTRRAYIPKTDGRMRALGIAAVEDKVVQRAVVEVMNAVYEEDFLGFSYGFRAGRSQHHALDALAAGIVHLCTQEGGRLHACQAHLATTTVQPVARDPKGNPQPKASADTRTGEMAGRRAAWLLPVPCGAHKQPGATELPLSGRTALASCFAPTRPARRDQLETPEHPVRPVAPASPGPPSLA